MSEPSRWTGADRQQHLACGPDQGDVAQAQLLAQPLEHEYGDTPALLAQPGRRQPGLGRDVGLHRLQGALAEREPGIQRAGQPEDQADAAMFLLSPAASFICGSVLFVDGGYDAMTRTDAL